MLTALAPAKLNLVLEVLGKRSDGYHEIRSLVQAVSLCDVLSFEPAEHVSLGCTEPSLQSSDNLVVQAAEVLREVSGCGRGVKIELEKRIPWNAGLGGGSSDAAAALPALNRLWELGLATSDLVGLAARLGSDVSFFIHGGTALVQGRGEEVTPLPASSPRWFVLLLPPLTKPPRKTHQLYSRLDARHFTGGELAARAAEACSQGKPVSASMLFNAFDEVAFDAFPGLEEFWKRLQQAGALDIHLAGSGPALFAPVDGEAEAEELHGRLCQQGLEAYSVSSVVPKVT